VPRAALAAALEQIDAIVRPPGDLYFTELRAQSGKLRFLPAMLRSVALGATPAGQPVMDAVRHLRSTDGRGPASSAPLSFVQSGWKRQVRAPDGGVDSLGYRLCLLDAMRIGGPSARPICVTQPALRGSADWSAGWPSLGGSPAVHLPHPRALDRCAGRGRAPGGAPGRCLPGHRGQLAQEHGRACGWRRVGLGAPAPASSTSGMLPPTEWDQARGLMARMGRRRRRGRSSMFKHRFNDIVAA
jgi:hypothetical protein